MSDFRASLAAHIAPKPKGSTEIVPPPKNAPPRRRRPFPIQSIKVKPDATPYYFALYALGAIVTLIYLIVNDLLLKWSLAQCIFAVLVWPIPALESMN